MSEVEPSKIVWTPELTRKFWNHTSQRPSGDQTYFTSIYGPAIFKWARRRVKLDKGMTVCDWGCGRGDLAANLVASGIHVVCVDQVASLTPSIAGDPLISFTAFANVAHLRDNMVDGAFLIETVEHLDDQGLAEVLTALHRIVRPNGFLIVTTPNEEQLSRSEVFCPNCDTVFHPMQHVRSVSSKWLSQVANEFGWHARYSEALEFEPRGAGRFVARARNFRSRWSGARLATMPPHLAWYGVNSKPR